MNEPVTRIVLGGIKLEPWPRYLGKLHRTPPERLEQYLGLSVARITVFKKIALNARFHELYLTQTYQKVTLYHMLRGIIPAGFFGAVCGVPFENLWAQIGVCIVSTLVGVVIAKRLPKVLWNRLGRLARDPKHVLDDAATAAYWRGRAERGGSFAQAALGYLQENGRGVTRDPVQAAAWYRRSAFQDDDFGKYLLASAYESGTGAPQDFVEAYKWYYLVFGKSLPDELAKHSSHLTEAQIAEAVRRADAF